MSGAEHLTPPHSRGGGAPVGRDGGMTPSRQHNPPPAISYRNRPRHPAPSHSELRAALRKKFTQRRRGRKEIRVKLPAKRPIISEGIKGARGRRTALNLCVLCVSA